VFAVAVLPKPYNTLDLQSGQSVTVQVERIELGDLRTDDTAKQPNRLWPMARLFGRRVDQDDARRYFDITSRMLLASLIPFLQHAGAYGRRVKITAYGVMYRKRFTWEAV
jgi:hypothetical protein